MQVQPGRIRQGPQLLQGLQGLDGPAGPFGTDGPGLVERLAGLGVLAADTDPDRVRLVFSYEVSAEEAERAAKVVVAAAG